MCWRLDKTGAVGESLLHLCMLNGTSMFIELAKRLLTHYPKMINDVYLGQDYFGKTFNKRLNLFVLIGQKSF